MYLSGLDELDQKILQLLIENARYSYSEIGERIGVSRVAVKSHINALEEQGIIGPFEGSKPRQVLITKERWIEMKMIAAAKAEDNRRNY